MKLTASYYYPVMTKDGVYELYNFCDSVLYKYNKGVDRGDYDDLRQEMILACLEALPKYDKSKNSELGGFLYWPCRGAISKWQNKRKRCLPVLAALLENVIERETTGNKKKTRKVAY